MENNGENRRSGTKLDMRFIEIVLIVLYIAWFVMILMVTSYPAPGFAAPGYAIVFGLTLLSLIYYHICFHFFWESMNPMPMW